MKSRAGKETFRFRLPSLLAWSGLRVRAFCFVITFSFLIANLAQRYHEFLFKNRNHMSKSKRFGGLIK
ncbi:hypothetical protein [Arenibacter sp. S6351L]|uniref:hypothetical protein n=1 Tax=Arenibacter sp. S6351L TaxID=2926407 RepID=UPI001FF1E31F|nr:hypothetical protein [Arenibacter sp. S6351L]MCK0136206.1 hypothetical protein [Arenibacter sp. S6351L]